MSTLETGAGASTIVFAAAGAIHEAVTPSSEEVENILAECAERGIETMTLDFHIGCSHEVLRSWSPRPLDLVLIDGAHGFPYPILDWWYLAPHVRRDGLVLLDDAYMPPVAALLDHLRSHRAWEIVQPLGYRTVVVQKVSDELPEFGWNGGRLGGRMNFRYLRAHHRALAALRRRTLDTGVGAHLVRLARRSSLVGASR